jgi:hypothetical protein
MINDAHIVATNHIVQPAMNDGTQYEEVDNIWDYLMSNLQPQHISSQT